MAVEISLQFRYIVCMYLIVSNHHLRSYISLDLPFNKAFTSSATTTHEGRIFDKEMAFRSRSGITPQICLPHSVQTIRFFDLCLHWTSVVRIYVY